MKPFRQIALALAAISLLLAAAQACGPDFAPDLFVHPLHPDNPKQYARGDLGILLPTYPRADLIVAFRYLNGGSLSASEQTGYQPSYSIQEPEFREGYIDNNPATGNDDNSPAAKWTHLRSHYPAAPPGIDPDRSFEQNTGGGFRYYNTYANCNADAFRTAVLTLSARARSWGGTSPDLLDWLHGQDAVFANCSKPASLPAPAPAAASTLLKQDRAYQTAAALFYAGKYPEARAAFETISKDSSSPWHALAPYLAARSLVRQAFFANAGPDDDGIANFDANLMHQAADRLKDMLGNPQPGAPLRAIHSQLDLVRIRIDTQTRLRELAAALTGPATDPDYTQHLKDLTWYLDNHLDQFALREDAQTEATPEQPKNYGDSGNSAAIARAASATYNQLASLRASSPLIDWLLTFQSPSPEAAAHAAQEWRRTRTLSWLAAAISKATEKSPEAPALLEAVAAIQPRDPAWQTIGYHRIRLLIALNRAPEARTLLADALPRLANDNAGDSAINAYNGLRMASAATLADLLNYAPRRILLRSSESSYALDECLDVMKDPKRVYDCKEDKSPVQFSDDAAAFFNTQAPLGILVESAQSPVLPETLRRSVAMMAWVRSVLLHDDAAAASLLPLLPAKLQEQAGAGTGFRPLVAIARNPGLRPFLDPGVQRMDSYDFIESYRDNWWCGRLRGGNYQDGRKPIPPVTVTYLTQTQRDETASQLKLLDNAQNAKLYLGSQIVAYAESHPGDQDAAESLYLVLRLIRYGCDDIAYPETPESKARNLQIDEIRRHAARLLRQHYAASPWTRKAAPFAG